MVKIANKRTVYYYVAFILIPLLCGIYSVPVVYVVWEAGYEEAEAGEGAQPGPPAGVQQTGEHHLRSRLSKHFISCSFLNSLSMSLATFAISEFHNLKKTLYDCFLQKKIICRCWVRLKLWFTNVFPTYFTSRVPTYLTLMYKKHVSVSLILQFNYYFSQKEVLASLFIL